MIDLCCMLYWSAVIAQTGTRSDAGVNRIAFDPAVIPYREILEDLFVSRDPTTLNRQGNDTGTQYRSAITITLP